VDDTQEGNHVDSANIVELSTRKSGERLKNATKRATGRGNSGHSAALGGTQFYSKDFFIRIFASLMVGMPDPECFAFGLADFRFEQVPPLGIYPIGPDTFRLAIIDWQERNVIRINDEKIMRCVNDGHAEIREMKSQFPEALQKHMELNSKTRPMVIADMHLKAKPVAKVKAFGWRSDPDFCFVRASFDPAPIDLETLKTKAPNIGAALDCMDRPDVFAAWHYAAACGIGSRKQVLCCLGESNSGKTSINQALGKAIFEDSYVAVDGYHFNDSNEFWAQPLVGTAMCLVDEPPRNIFQKELFKTATGRTSHMVNPKNKAPFMADINCRFVIAMNKQPTVDQSDIHNQGAQLSRMVLVNFVNAITFEGRSYEQWSNSIASEIEHFYGYGARCYETLKGQLQQADLEDLIESHACYGYQHCFEEVPHCQGMTLASSELRSWCYSHNFSYGTDQEAVKNMLIRKFGAKYTRTKRHRGLIGVRLKH